jgi:hypothetical protein
MRILVTFIAVNPNTAPIKALTQAVSLYSLAKTLEKSCNLALECVRHLVAGAMDRMRVAYIVLREIIFVCGNGMCLGVQAPGLYPSLKLA